jgi:hypothetical protein
MCPAAAGGGPPVQKPKVFARGTLGQAGARIQRFELLFLQAAAAQGSSADGGHTRREQHQRARLGN